jgi:molybdopterin molybdotransferase
MISVQEASNIISSHVGSFGTELVALDNALGRVLAENIHADRDFPPFNRVAMDGICIRFEDFKNGQRSFPIQSTQAAGSPPQTLNVGAAIEIMTGAVLSHDADSVIRYEDLDIKENISTIVIGDVRFGQNVHKQGSDRNAGDNLILKDTRITATEIGILATVGKSQLKVYKQPSVAIVSTGDELVDVEQSPMPHQIRKSNVHSLKALLNGYGISPELIHLGDNKNEISKTVSSILANNDVILMSGAVSKGKFDFLPEVLENLGVKKHFHKVEQRPGKPFWFGTKSNTCVFAFPGNPVSTFVCAKRFFEPWLKKSLKIPMFTQFAQLTDDVSFKPNLTYFLQVKLSNSGGTILAHPTPGNGSGDLANLAVADAFLELPADRQTFEAGEVFSLLPF